MFQDANINDNHNPWPSQTQSTQWTRAHDKKFEEALLVVPEDLPNRWEKIAERVPGMSPMDVKRHYEALVHDVFEIDSGRVEVPSYGDDSTAAVEAAGSLSGWDSASQISFGTKSKHSETERKKGTPWTEEEHRLFLIGLHKFGKGDWRSISRNCVVTRTPTQVASHAQKYFLRQNSVKRERKRSSIHDITTVDNNTVPMPIDQNWVPSPGGLMQQSQEMQNLNPPGCMPDQMSGYEYQNYGFQM